MLSEEAGRVAWQSRPSGCGVLGLGACWGLGGLDLGFNRDGLSLVWEAFGLKPSAFGSQRSDWELGRFCGLLTGCIISEVTCCDTLGSHTKASRESGSTLNFRRITNPVECYSDNAHTGVSPLIWRLCCMPGLAVKPGTHGKDDGYDDSAGDQPAKS